MVRRDGVGIPRHFFMLRSIVGGTPVTENSYSCSIEDESLIRTVVHIGQKPTDAKIREIEKAAAMPVVPDEDTPELTLEQCAEMAEIVRNRQ